MLFALLLQMGIALLLRTLHIVCSVALRSDFEAEVEKQHINQICKLTEAASHVLYVDQAF